MLYALRQQSDGDHRSTVIDTGFSADSAFVGLENLPAPMIVGGRMASHRVHQGWQCLGTDELASAEQTQKHVLYHVLRLIGVCR
jgi:hypothetical protein